MRRSTTRCLGAVVIGLVLALPACGDDGGGDEEGGGGRQATVAAANFPESNILAQLYGQVLEAEDFDITVEEDFGARPALLDALADNTVDLTPEYVGALLNELEGPDTASADRAESVELLDAALDGRELVAFRPSKAQNVDALAVTQETAEEFDLETYTDLAGVAGELTLGAPAECAEFAACIPGLRSTYGIEFGEFVPLEAGPPIFEALSNGDIDVARVFSTDPPIGEEDLVVLEDDKGLNPVQNVVPVARKKFGGPIVEKAVNKVSAALTTKDLIALNARVIVDKEDPEDVAREYLEDKNLI
jgi:osmoprotectant transport system substrate-binding protein